MLNRRAMCARCVSLHGLYSRPPPFCASCQTLVAHAAMTSRAVESTRPAGPGVPGDTMASGLSSTAAQANSTSAALASAGLSTSASSMANYKIVSTIGRGNFGVCHLCECIDTRR
jgi:hypothetical protein